MAVKTAAELAIDVTTNAAAATAGFSDVGDSVGRLERDVTSMGDAAERSSRGINLSADAADELGGKAGKATGALGALSSGFELVGAEKYAGALQAAGLATDFMSGVGDSLNLVMESTIVKNVRARAATIANAVATRTAAAGTAIMTAAQWALNAAMSANPIALIVIALVALVAGLVLAYKKSETFRNIVNGAFRAVQAAATAAFNWIKRNWPLLLAIITGPIGLAIYTVVKKWDDIKAAVRATKKYIGDRIGEIPGIISGVASTIERIITAPFRAAKRIVQEVLDLIGKIKPPSIDLNPFNGRVAAPSAGRVVTSGAAVVAAPEAPTVQIIVQGALDPVAVARQINALLGDQMRRIQGSVA